MGDALFEVLDLETILGQKPKVWPLCQGRYIPMKE